MPYAAANKVSRDRFDGSLEISDKQYSEAIEGMMSGMEVTIDGGFKISPPADADMSEPNEKSQDIILQDAFNLRDQRIKYSSIRISPLQYAVDLGISTDSEEEKLSRWKMYCVELNRIQDQAGFPNKIEWPTEPE